MTYGAKPQLRTVKTGSVIKDFCVDIVTYKGYFDMIVIKDFEANVNSSSTVMTVDLGK